MLDEAIQKKIAALPERPGVYFMKDAAGTVIYIGKAKNLRQRALHYTHDPSPGDDPKIVHMISRIADIDHLELPTEIDALIAEARLIKDTQPKYNVQLKDDKSFPLLKITNDDDFPKISVTRERDEKQGEYFGPFIDAEGLRESVKILQKVFKFATCSLTIRADDDKRRFFRPCILYNINRCTAPCADRITKEEYADDVESLRQFLHGRRKKLIHAIHKNMEEAAGRLDFERAAELRDQVRALDSLTKKAIGDDYLEGDLTPIDPKSGTQELAALLNSLAHKTDGIRSIDGVDVATMAGADSVGSVVTFVDGVPWKEGYRRYKIKTVEGVDDYAMIREIVDRRYRRLMEESAILPDLLLIDGGIGHLAAAAAVLAEIGVSSTALLSLAKEEETVFAFINAAPRRVETIGDFPNARHLLMYIRDEAHRFAQYYHHILRRKALLPVKEPTQ